MSDVTASQNAQTPEAVALELFKIVANAERRVAGTSVNMSRTDILSTYAECLRVVKGNGGGQEPMPVTCG